MDEHGKEKEVLFEDAISVNNLTKEEGISDNAFFVWADENLLEIISKVTGVAKAKTSEHKTRYFVEIDRRYNMEFIKKELEAAILCRE